MADLSAFPITRQYPAQHPDRLQLYSLPTPNGVKVSILLEELGLAYEPHLVDIGKNETWTPDYLSLNPNGKIPAIIDPDGPGGGTVRLTEHIQKAPNPAKYQATAAIQAASASARKRRSVDLLMRWRWILKVL